MNIAQRLMLPLTLALMVGTGAASAADLKIAFVTAIKASAAAPQYEAASELLEEEFASRDQELVALQKKIRSQEERLQRDGAIMSESERRELERSIIEGQRELRRAQEEFREDLNIRRNEELGKLQRTVVEAIRALAKKQGYDLVVSDGVIYASEQVDITDKVIDRLKREFNGR